MGTNYIAPIWRMPENTNKDKLSNYSIEFDSSNTDYIQISDNNLSGLEKFSISIWYNSAVPETSGDRALFASWSGTTQQAILYLDNPNGWRFLWNDGVGASGSVAGPSTVTVDEWNHIVITYDGATVKFYHNNGTPTTNATVKGPIQASTSLPRIGSDTNTTKLWDGKISQFCLFDKAIDASQVEYLYNLNNPMVPGSKNLPTPIQYLPLGDNSNPNATGSFPNIVTGADSVFDFIPNDYINLGTNLQSTLSLAQNTISFWFKSDTASDFDTVFSQGKNDSIGYRFFVSGASLSINRSEQNPTNSRQSLDVAFEHQKWNHIVLITDTANTEYITAYLNGDPVGTYSTGTITYSNGGTEAWIGGQFGISQYWDGQVSNVQIWSTNISATEVATLYNNGQPLMTGTQPQAANLKAWYKLNQTANWEADSTGNWQIPDNRSAYPQSFNFDGSDDWIEAPKISPTIGITVSAWINTTTTSGTRVIVCEDRFSTTPQRDWALYLDGGNNLRFNAFNPDSSGSSSINLAKPAASITDGKWHNVCFTWDGTTDTNAAKIVFDGTDITQGTATATGIKNTSPYDLAIGQVQTGAGYNFNGKLSNVQVWDASITTLQIEQLYNNGTPLTNAIATDSLKAWYKLSNNEKFDGANWSIENEKYPANYESSLKFTGNDLSGSELSLASSTTPSDDTAVSFWMKANSQSGYGTICYGGGGTDMAYQYLSTNGSGSNLYIYDGTFTKIIDDAYNGKWNHIVISYDNSANEVKGYKNGVLDQTVTATWGNQSFIDRLGFRNNIRYYNGQLSNFGIFTSVLEQSDVNTLYNNGTPLVDMSSFSSLDAFWKLDNLASGLLDTIGNNNASTTDVVKVNNFVSTEAATSSGMTEQNLVNNNVSVLNGESSSMDTTNLVQSNLTRKQPYSSYSMNFDSASADYLEVADPGEAILAYGENKFSFSGWINPKTFENQGGLITRHKDSLARTTLKLTYQNGFDGVMFQSIDSPATANFHIVWDNILTGQVWQHVCFVYDGANTSCKIYINGEDQGAGVITGSIPSSLPNFNGSPLYIAVDAMNGLNNRNFNGKFSNFCVFNRVLSESEILKIYNNGITQNLQKTSSFSNNISAWWPMDENNSYYDGADWVVREVENGNDGQGANTGNVDDMVGNAPGSNANGIGNNLIITSLKGDMDDSELNAYSINMADYADSVVNPANSGRSTNVP